MRGSRSSKAWDRAYTNRARLWAGTPPDLLLVRGRGRVLEIGCGDGRLLAASSGGQGEVVGIDFSGNALALCRRNPGLTGRVDLCLADALHLPFSDNSFGAVLAHHVVGHADAKGREAIALEIARVLVPGGVFSFRDFAVGDMREGSGTRVEEGSYERSGGILVHYFRIPEIEALFSMLFPIFIRESEWPVRLRGRLASRIEVEAEFVKRPDPVENPPICPQ
ncbi:MAG: class I SAM-dependent methyltransferase [Methanoregulaceae archaeon]|nr:class I SAM-dependent methyltransferase [Methanoregulaceae archaeon]